VKHILFVTSTSLAANPRCLKEIKLALKHGYKVSLVSFSMNNWTKEKDALLRQELTSVSFYDIPAARTPFLSWLKASLAERICRVLSLLFFFNGKIIAYAQSKRAYQLQRFLKKIKIYPDLLVAHNPAAFYPAAVFSKNHNIKLGIDVEDYHPGEGNDKKQEQYCSYLMEKLLPMADYVSFASPLIYKSTHELIYPSAIKKALVVNNVFGSKEFPLTCNEKAGIMSCVWFSQNISYGRGLENFLAEWEPFRDKFSLTLIGNMNDRFYENELVHRPFVEVLPSLTPADLHQKITEYDIGLALEPKKDLNNDLALSNKIWSYYQSGLFILASDTTAQKKFIELHPNHGVIFSFHSNLGNVLLNIYEQKDRVIAGKTQRYLAAQGNSWDTEGNKLVQVWEKIYS
jgi:hypothetical protein